MKRTGRIAAFIVSASLLASLTGCASMFDKSYFSAADYEGTEQTVSTTGDIAVSNYFALKLAITQLIAQHRDEASLDLSGYVGDITKDIASACKEANNETALGAYSVDYITYDLDRIIAFYEAVVYINYRRTAEEVAEVMNVDSESGLYDALTAALNEGERYLAVSVAATGFGENDAMNCAMKAYRNNPLSSVTVPDFDVTVYSGKGLQKIFEYRMTYGTTPELKNRSEQLLSAVEELGGQITAEGDAYRALQAATLLVERCMYEEKAGNAAWNALVGGAAGSEGMAMAYKALCDEANVPCEVVSGRLDKETHYWNIISAAGSYYHVDVSRVASDGMAESFLCSDSDMWGRYWWDTGEHDPCEGGMDYAALIAETPEETSPPEETPTETQPPEETAQLYDFNGVISIWH